MKKKGHNSDHNKGDHGPSDTPQHFYLNLLGLMTNLIVFWECVSLHQGQETRVQKGSPGSTFVRSFSQCQPLFLIGPTLSTSALSPEGSEVNQSRTLINLTLPDASQAIKSIPVVFSILNYAQPHCPIWLTRSYVFSPNDSTKVSQIVYKCPKSEQWEIPGRKIIA